MHSIDDEKNGEPSLRIVGLWPLLIPILFILPNLGSIPFPGSGAQYSDIAVSHLPNLIFLRKAFTEYHTIPLWSPTIMSGYPFFADPISGLHYPPGWLAGLLPLPVVLNILIIIHLLWGGIGMYRLSRILGLSHLAALLAALAFEAMPKIFAHYGAGHLTLLYAIPWTPWLLYFAIRSWKREKWSPLEALTLAMIFLADPRWAPYAGLLWLAFGIFIRSSHTSTRMHPRNWRWLPYQLALCGLLVAPLALPLLEFENLSTRAGLLSTDVLTFSFPPSRLLGLIYPDFGGFHEWVIYPGAVVIVFSLAALFGEWSKLEVRFWGLVALVCILVALGDFLPIGRLLATVPGFDMLRVPPRILGIFGMALSILAGIGFDVFIRYELRNRAGLLLGGMGAFAGILTLGIIYLTKRVYINFVWGGSAIVITIICVLVARGKRGNRLTGTNSMVLYTANILIVFMLVDLGWTDATLIDFHAPNSITGDAEPVVDYLDGQPGMFRVYSPSYSIPQTAAARAGLELADGVHPLQIASYSEYMVRASGVPREGYSVTIPSFSGGDPSSGNKRYLPDPDLLGMLNVAYLVSEFELNVESLTLLKQFGDTRVYKNEVVRERAWVMRNSSDSLTDAESIDSLIWEPNRIVIEAGGTGRLVLSEIVYPGWIATVNGVRHPIQVENDILRAVDMVGERNEIVFSFRPLSLYIGLGLALLGVVLIGIQFVRVRNANA